MTLLGGDLTTPYQFLRVAEAMGELDAFSQYLTRLRERHRRRPTLIAILDKANLR